MQDPLLAPPLPVPATAIVPPCITVFATVLVLVLVLVLALALALVLL